MTDIATEFILVRHGQTESNVAGRIQGHSDSPLTDIGSKQAQELALKLAKMEIDVLWTSDLGRALSTAKILAEPLNRELQIDPRLREVRFGEVEGLRWDQVEQMYPDLRRNWYDHRANARLPGGESREEVTSRVFSVLEECVSSYRGKRILAVTHGGVLACLFSSILQIPPGIRPQCSIDNTTINILQFAKGRWNIQTWNAKL